MISDFINRKMCFGIFLVFICGAGRTQTASSHLLDGDAKISAKRAVELYEKGYKEDPWVKHPDAATLAWGEFYTLQALVDLYEATEDRKYLDEVAFRGGRVLTHRDDKRGVTDGSGISRPAWTMGQDFVTAEAKLLDSKGRPVIELRSTTFDYNNSTRVVLEPIGHSRFNLVVSNERKNRTETFTNLSLNPSDDRYIEKIVNDPKAPPQAKPGSYTEKSNLLRVTKVHRGRRPGGQSLMLSPIPLAFMGYTGIIYDPMMRFAEVVKNNKKLSDLLPTADRFIRAAEETYSDAVPRLWRNGPGEDEGYYLCSEKGESFPWDNVGLPFNFLAKHVCTELALYRLTNKREYLDRSQKMINLFRNRLRYKSENNTYSWDYWYEPVTTTGWEPADGISENIRFLKPFSGPEDISHAAITISLVEAGYKMGVGFDKTDMKRFANTLLYNILQEDGISVSSDVAGQGKGQEYFPQIYGYLCLTEGNPRVYTTIKDAYLKWEREHLPFCAALLKWDNKAKK